MFSCSCKRTKLFLSNLTASQNEVEDIDKGEGDRAQVVGDCLANTIPTFNCKHHGWQEGWGRHGEKDNYRGTKINITVLSETMQSRRHWNNFFGSTGMSHQHPMLF
jgi:hypothetical protein